MKPASFAIIVGSLVAGRATASPAEELHGRQAGCDRDNCLRAVAGLRPGAEVALADCSSWMIITETPCLSTVTQTATVTSFTTTVDHPFPGLRKMKREELEGRQASSTAAAEPSCVPLQNSPSNMPAYIQTACQLTIGSLVPTARYSSACSCDGVLATTTTLPASSTTVTSTSTILAAYTPTEVPDAFILQSSGDGSLYVTVEGNGAIRLINDITAASPFYLDRDGQLHNFNSRNKTLVNYYQPNPAAADNKVYNDVQSDDNYRITCREVILGPNTIHGDCESSSSSEASSVVRGFIYCPDEGGYLYMGSNWTSMRCVSGYFFRGFRLQAYTSN
ncbi:FAD dependent oxidoreductase [Colletotrichum truncatum]|uniref:FAD dependent oxidoreductase n=1 Tax=Colletotrichum truncatum TaxID=5467 RepID=A0ACC3Z3K9_COLTU|nr:FAD dependent oxidoreductase [Colletotrichum truncatum]KAF6793132.1 FAD dependent oxidoreductase [Colletotrichum truncatum]